MIQILLHLWGDYITQNDWMATNKTQNTAKGWVACLIHVTLYSLPFLFICSFEAFVVIFTTHFFIDKFRLAKYLVQLKNFSFTPTGFPPTTPLFISVWVTIIVDNILHVTINYLSITFL